MSSILTVIAPAASKDLTTVETVRAKLRLTDTSRDAELLQLIRQASGAIAKHCRREFAQETVLEVFRERRAGLSFAGVPALPLARYPVTSIASVEACDAPLDPAQYEYDPRNGLLYRLCGETHVPWLVRKIAVTYTAGYALLGDLPYEIEDACIRLVSLAWYALGRDPLLKSESVPGVMDEVWIDRRADADGALPPDVVSLLAGHRNLLIG